MSFSTVGLSVHQDDKHSGSAKRGAANGVAPLGADSKVPDANSQVASTHPTATTGVHGVGASTVESASGSQSKVDTHAALETGIHGVGASTVASEADISTHSALTTGAHGAGANTILNSGDTGTTANKILKLDGNGKIPAVDGSQLTNLPSVVSGYIPSSNVLASHDATLYPQTNTSYALKKTITLGYIGNTTSIIVSFDLRGHVGTSSTGYAKIYKNGAPVGTERTNSSDTYSTFSETISVASGDTIELWGKTPNTNYGIQNFRLGGSPQMNASNS